MYVVYLNYFRPAEEADALLAPHIEWLDRYFDSGDFIAEIGRASCRERV